MRTRAAPIVIKADGLAAGKGVVIATSVAEAERALTSMLRDGLFGAAGTTVVIEDFLTGEEASFIALVDGTDVVPLASSQDHKTRDDGDRGPNTGGMGAYSPAPVVSATVHERVMDKIMRPTVRGLVADGIRYRGFLYAGLMIDAAGEPRVIEFNCRLGDPETQPIVARLRSDLVALCLSSFDGTLGNARIDWDPRAAVGVVMASGGYPGSYAKGKVIRGLERASGDDVKIFHAGTRLRGTDIVTDGGRVLCAVGLGASVGIARRQGLRRRRENRVGRGLLADGHRLPRVAARAGRLTSMPAILGRQRFIASKKSALVFVSCSLDSRNSTAASSSIGCSTLRRIHIFCSSSGCVKSSSLRVPERLMLIEGNTRFSEIRRSRWISMLPVPLNSS